MAYPIVFTIKRQKSDHIVARSAPDPKKEYPFQCLKMSEA
jgi:hypothetical protein